jgi:hypothetical protein
MYDDRHSLSVDIILTPNILLHALTVLSEAGSPAICNAVARSTKGGWIPGGGGAEGWQRSSTVKITLIYSALNENTKVKKESGKYSFSFVNIYIYIYTHTHTHIYAN